MTVQTLDNEIRNARILAQRLYGQCRKSATIWRSLSPDLRHMRNSIEELEERVLDNALPDVFAAPVLQKIQPCILSLRALDRNLQFYRCSAARWHSVISETVEEARTALAVASAGLRAIYDSGCAMQASCRTQPSDEGIRGQPQVTNDLAAEPGFIDGAMCAFEAPAVSSVVLEARSSRTTADAPGNSVDGGNRLLEPCQIPLPQSPSLDAQTNSQARPEAISGLISPGRLSHQSNNSDWRSPFAEVDPLSVDFDSATSYLLGELKASADQPDRKPNQLISTALHHDAPLSAPLLSSDSLDQDLPFEALETFSETVVRPNASDAAEEEVETETIANRPDRARLSIALTDLRRSSARIGLQEGHEMYSFGSDDCQDAQAVPVYQQERFKRETFTGVAACETAEGGCIGTVISPRSRFYAQQIVDGQCTFAQPSRVDSKTDLNYSVPSLPPMSMESATASRIEHAVESVQFDMLLPYQPPTSGPVSPLSPSLPELAPSRQSTMVSYLQETSSNVAISGLVVDMVQAVDQIMAPPLPPKGRYHIVNPSPRSSSNTLESESQATVSRSVSPLSSSASGEIQVMIVKDTSDFTHMNAAHASGLATTETTRKQYSREGNTSLQSIDIETYGRQPQLSPASSRSSFLSEDDVARIENISQSWRHQEWSRAEAYLLGLLNARDGGRHDRTTRRVQHLLGVSASFQGQWQRAIGYFLSVLTGPLVEISQLDEGDCAALTWLMDCYTLTNRRLEAYISSTLCLQAFSTQAKQSGLYQIVSSELKLIANGSGASLHAQWDTLRRTGTFQKKDSIGNEKFVSSNFIKQCVQRAESLAEPSIAKSSMRRNRATILCEIDSHSSTVAECSEFRVQQDSFSAGTRWPMPYDPFFSIDQVAAGRLCDEASDILGFLQTNGTFKLPRPGPLATSRSETFRCANLPWLVIAVRDCLACLEMRWDERISAHGIHFMARFATKHANIVTANYFLISVFRQSIRQGYGLEVCADGVRSARVMHGSSDEGPQAACEKRLKKFFKDYLAKSHRIWQRNGKPSTRVNPILAASGELAKQASGLVAKGLPLPPRTDVTLVASCNLSRT